MGLNAVSLLSKYIFSCVNLMDFRLKTRCFQVLFLVTVALLWASLAYAGPSHHHHHADVVSPFDKLDSVKPLHCVLNMHQHTHNKPCPHKVHGEAKDYYEFRADCGSHKDSANSSSSSLGFDFYKDNKQVVLIPIQLSEKLESFVYFEKQNLPRSIDHPPQLV